MEQPIGRPRVAWAYAALIALTPLTVIVQGISFAAFYSEGGKTGYIDVHSAVADISLLVVVLIVTPVAFLARFRRSRRIGWLTLTLAVLWFVQHSLGYGIIDARWISTIHIPLALLIFGLALYLTDRVYRALKGRAD